MQPPRRRITVRMMMALVLFAAIWSYIVVQSLEHRRRHPAGSDWHLTPRNDP